jgi:hypothetical protein
MNKEDEWKPPEEIKIFLFEFLGMIIFAYG